MSAPQKKGNH